MKTTRKLLIVILLFMAMNIFAQAPQAFNYQAVARDASGTLITNQGIAVKISILQDFSPGILVYSERHTPTTNQFGLFTVAIGQGSILSGTFNTITWSSGNYWLKVEMDPTGSTTYTDMGTARLLAVPFAMYAVNAGTSGVTGPTGPAGANGTTVLGGTGTLSPAVLVIDNGGIRQNNSPDKGIVIIASNGTCWKVSVDTNGNLTTQSVVCP